MDAPEQPGPSDASEKAALPGGFDLLHYNGLVHSAGDELKLTKFCVAPLIGDDFFAATTGGLGEPIEDTIHCRWPGASIHWYDGTPGKI